MYLWRHSDPDLPEDLLFVPWENPDGFPDRGETTIVYWPNEETEDSYG